MSDGVLIALIGGGVTLLIAIGGGSKWIINRGIELWEKALSKRDAEIADLRKIREDTLVQAIAESKAAAVEASSVANEARELSRENNRLLHELLAEWKGRP